MLHSHMSATISGSQPRTTLTDTLHPLLLTLPLASDTQHHSPIPIIAGRSLSIEKVAVMSGPYMNTRTIERIIVDRAKLQIEGAANIWR